MTIHEIIAILEDVTEEELKALPLKDRILILDRLKEYETPKIARATFKPVTIGKEFIISYPEDK